MTHEASARLPSVGGGLACELKASYPELGALPPATFEVVFARTRALVVPAGTGMFDDHAACEAMPFLLDGAIRVSKASASGCEILLYRVHAGEACVLTSGCLIGRTACAARGVVERDARLVLLPERAFRQLVATEESLRTYVFALFSARLGDMMALVEVVAFQRLDQRLAVLLLGRGQVPLSSALLGYCPAYTLPGIDSCPMKAGH